MLVSSVRVQLCCRQSEAQSCFGEVVADLAVHTDPPREPGSAHVEPLAGLALVGKHWWSWEDDKMSFKQYWKAEESLPRIPAPVLGVKDSLHFPSVLDQVLKSREWQQIRSKAESGKRIR